MAIRKVATFDAFDGDNDTHGGNDFGSFDLAGAALYPYELPSPATLTDPSITLTYTLAVSAIRKGNTTPATPWISCVSASHTRLLRGATIFSFWVVFLSCGYRELILSLARTPESRGCGTPFRGVRPSWLSGVLSVLPDGHRQRSKHIARLAMADSSAGAA